MRLVAVLFSKGYVAHDDHFIPVETAYLWLSGQADFFSDKQGAWRNQLYTLWHYLIFAGLQKINIVDPKLQMLGVRFLHAIYSLLTIIYGYLFTKLLSDKKTAIFVANLLAFLWFLPYVSVHSLVETVCVPPIIMGFYYTHLATQKKNKLYWILAGLCFAFAFSIRFQTFVLGLAIGIFLIAKKQFIDAIFLLLATSFFLLILMGIVDTIAFGYPFASFIQYSLYNLQISPAVAQPWYFYIVLLLFVLFFPTSLIFVFGLSKLARKYWIYLISLACFVALHSFFTNKQERFIIPAIILLVILGMIGWNRFVATTNFARYKKIIVKTLWVWFWFWNILLLFLITPSYPKKNLIESLYYLSKKNDVTAILIDTPANRLHLPLFYLQHEVPIFKITNKTSKIKKIMPLKKEVNYFIFLGDKPSQTRIREIEKLQKISLKEEKLFTYNKLEAFLWGRSKGNVMLKTASIYKKI